MNAALTHSERLTPNVRWRPILVGLLERALAGASTDNTTLIREAKQLLDETRTPEEVLAGA